MNVDIFAEWFRRQGLHVVRTASSFWVENAPRAYQAFPYHALICPPAAELADLLQQTGGIVLRYSAPWEAQSGMASYHAVYQRQVYTMKDLNHWARKNVRRGLRNCTIEPIRLEQLAAEGWPLQRDTLERQRRRLKFTRDDWTRLCLSAADLPGFAAWGARAEGQLAASLITFQMDDWGYLLYQQCLRNYMPLNVNNALGFVATQGLLGQAGIKSILYGLHSLDAPPSIDEFKFRMGYTARPVRQVVSFRHTVSWLVNPASHRLVRLASRLDASNPYLAKAEGLMRFYLQGRRPLDEQKWPVHLPSDSIG